MVFGNSEQNFGMIASKFTVAMWYTHHVVAFPAEDQDLQEDDDDDFQATFGARYVCTFFCVCDLFFSSMFYFGTL